MMRRPPRSTLFPYTSSSDLLWKSIASSVSANWEKKPSTCSWVAGRASGAGGGTDPAAGRSEEHTSELQSRRDLVCRLLLEKKKKDINESTSASKNVQHLNLM